MTLLAAYNFDEASGDVLDVTGNGHGFAMNASVTRQSGHTSTGLRHETTASNGAGPAIFGQTAQRTIMAWVKRSNNGVDGWVVEMKDGVGDTGLFGFLFSGGNVQARLKNTGSTVYTVSTAQPTVNAWYHIAMTFDGSKVHLFINGTEVGTGTTTTGTLHVGATIFPFMDTVGTETIIDDVRVYDTALSGAQITTDMNTPVSGASVNSGTLTGSFSSATASFTGTSIPADRGTLTGGFSSPTTAFVASGRADAALSGSFSPPAASMDVTATAEVTVQGTFAAPVTAIDAHASAAGSLAGSFAAPTFSLDGSSTSPNAGELNGSFTQPVVDAAGRASVDVSMIGTFSIPAFTGSGGIPIPDRDILVTIGPGERPATSIAAGPPRTSVVAGDFKRTEIGA